MGTVKVVTNDVKKGWKILLTFYVRLVSIPGHFGFGGGTSIELSFTCISTIINPVLVSVKLSLSFLYGG